MLLDEHGGKDNQNADDIHRDPESLPVHRRICTPKTKHDSDRVVYVDTGTDIGWRICLIQVCHHAGKQIVPRHHLWAKILYIGENKRNHQHNGHSDHQEDGYGQIGPAVFQIQADHVECDIAEPHEIRNHKRLDERNSVIQRRVNDRIMQSCCLFEQREDQYIHQHENQHRPGIPGEVTPPRIVVFYISTIVHRPFSGRNIRCVKIG